MFKRPQSAPLGPKKKREKPRYRDGTPMIFTEEKLHKLATPVKRTFGEISSRQDDIMNCTFQPQITKKGAEDDRSTFMDRLEKYDKEYKKIKQVVPGYIPSECTFQPMISAKAAGIPTNRADFVNRMYKYEHEKVRKLEAVRENHMQQMKVMSIPARTKSAKEDNSTFMERLANDLADRASKDQRLAEAAKNKDTSFSFQPQIFGKKDNKIGTIDDFLGRLSGDLQSRQSKWALRDEIFGLAEGPEKGKKLKQKPSFAQLQKNIAQLYQK